MALIKCPECGNEVSSKATKCPNCGLPVTQFNAPTNIDYNKLSTSDMYKQPQGGLTFWQTVGAVVVGSFVTSLISILVLVILG